MNIIILLISTTIVLAILIGLLMIFYKEILSILTNICNNCREFIGENSGFFTIGFTLLFGLEETLLIFAAFHFDIPKLFSAIIGIFAVIVIITASLEKFIWEHKYQYAREIAKTRFIQNRLFLRETKQLIDEHEKLKEKNKRINTENEKLRNKIKKLKS